MYVDIEGLLQVFPEETVSSVSLKGRFASGVCAQDKAFIAVEDKLSPCFGQRGCESSFRSLGGRIYRARAEFPAKNKSLLWTSSDYAK